MADLFAGAIPLSDQVAELERECAMRDRLYQQWVRDGRMKQDVADRQSTRMAAALKTLRELQETRGGK